MDEYHKDYAKMRFWIKSRIQEGRYAETKMSHEEDSLLIMEREIACLQPQVIVEFGTFAGGLTMFFHELDRNRPLYTFDIYPMEAVWARAGLHKGKEEHLRKFRRLVFNHNVAFITHNIIKQESDLVRIILSQPVRKFLYCDNGNKPQEINLYAKYLQPGDMMGVHDWGVEVSYDDKGVKESLKDFIWHDANRELEQKGLLTRLFLKTDGTQN